jgi:hypothetical protein
MQVRDACADLIDLPLFAIENVTSLQTEVPDSKVNELAVISAMSRGRAIQSIDRFHLVINLSETVERDVQHLQIDGRSER